MISQEPTCNGPHRGGEPRTPLDGTRLCVSCTRGLARDLAALPQLYDQCGRLLGGRDSAPAGMRTSGGGPVPGLPFNTSAADARAAIMTLTASWSGLVASERRITRPPRKVLDLSRFLLRHLSWLLAHPAAPELVAEVAEAAGAARRVIDPEPQRSIPVGDCVEPDCAGTLTALVRLGGTALSADVVCSAQSAHRWSAQDWAHLSSRVSQARLDTVRWLSATAISRLWGVPTGSVYRMASEQGWTRVQRDGRVYYSSDDVHRSFAARAKA